MHILQCLVGKVFKNAQVLSSGLTPKRCSGVLTLSLARVSLISTAVRKSGRNPIYSDHRNDRDSMSDWGRRRGFHVSIAN